MKKQLRTFLMTFCLFSCLHADIQTEDLKRQVCMILPSLEGWCSKEKALHFIDLVLEVKPEVCVEIGVFGGSSLFPVASALKFLDEGIIIAIDPWDKIESIKFYDPIKDEANLKWWGKVNLDHIYYSYLNMIRRYRLENYCMTLRSTSEKAAAEIDSIDILHIDGNHSELTSILDVLLYLPKVRSGGYIWLNDSLWPERQQAIDSLLECCDVIKLIDNGNCILFKKR